MSNNSKIFFFSRVIALCFLSACGGEKKTERIYPVVLAEVIQQDVPIIANEIGNVYSLQTVQIRPQVGGIIQEAYVKQGQYVKKGDPLYKIDPRPFQDTLDKAKAALVKDQAALDLAKITVQRNAELVKKDYISKLNFEQYQANVTISSGQILSDQADIKIAELNLEWATPKSPIEGKISQYNIDVGNLVTANDPAALTDIRQIDPADIRFTINQKDFVEVQKSLKEGSLKFHVFLPQASESPREGTIYFIDNHIDLATGTILLRGTVPNKDEFFWPGEFVNIKLQFRVQPNAILAPEEAVMIGQDGPFVYVYKPDTSTVEYRKVKKGENIDHRFLIEEGLQAGEKVVVKGQINLRPDSKVSIEQPSQPAKAASK